jgi:hypothetical protein
MALREKTVAQIEQKGWEAWAIQTDMMDKYQIEWHLLVHRPQHELGLVVI